MRKLAIICAALALCSGCKKQPRAKVEEQVARLNAENKSKCAYWEVGGTKEQPVAHYNESKCNLGKSFDEVKQ